MTTIGGVSAPGGSQTLSSEIPPAASRHRLVTLGGWLTLIMGATVLVVGLPMMVLGVRLIQLGGSWYYTIAGTAFVAAAVQLLRERRSGYWIYVLAFAGTIIWSFWESGAYPWALIPRLLTFTVILGVCWATWRWIDPRLLPRATRGGRAHTLAVSIAALTAVATLSVALLHGATRTDRLADRVLGGAPRAFAHQVTGASDIADGEWAHYGRTLAGQRYSPLADITPANVQRLHRVWTYHTGATQGPTEGEPRRFAFEATPLAVGGRLYFCTPHAEAISIDATTGHEVWRFDPKGDVSQVPFMGCRGVSYHANPQATGQCDRRILFATLTARLYALDADTGHRCSGFGANGEVDLTTGMGVVDPGVYYVTSPPAVVGEVAVLGGWVFDNLSRGEPSGVVRAFDVTTGALVWAFDMGHLDRNSLPPDGDSYTHGTPNVWAPISADPELGLVYLPTGNETPDFFGGGRQKESELYASSLLAVDARTGALRWHFQTVHHDLWDLDVPAQPVLVDVPVKAGAAPTPAVLVATKTGQLFMLDRRDGRPLAAVDERPAPQIAAPGDFLSPTQPYSAFPSLGPPGLTEADMWGAFPVDQLQCRILFYRYRHDGLFTPPSINGSIFYPSSFGVYEWGGISVDPKHDVMYANTTWLPIVNRLIPRAEAPKTRPIGDLGGPALGTPYASAARAFVSSLGFPCNQPPWGHLTAIDLVSRRVVWREPLGTAIPGFPVTLGLPNMGGSVVTAGGLVFIGASADRTFRAFDAATGKQLWRDVLPANANATPIIYRGADGRQYVAVAAGGHGGMGPTGDAVVAYALPTGEGQ